MSEPHQEEKTLSGQGELPESEHRIGFRLADRLALRPKEVAKVLGLSERLVREIMPELPKIRVGKALLVPTDCLREWLREQAKTEQSRADAAVEEVISGIRD